MDLLGIPSVEESGAAHFEELRYPGLTTYFYDERLGMFSKAARAQANGKVSSEHCETEEAKLEMKKWREENVHLGPAGQNLSGGGGVGGHRDQRTHVFHGGQCSYGRRGHSDTSSLIGNESHSSKTLSLKII